MEVIMGKSLIIRSVIELGNDAMQTKDDALDLTAKTINLIQKNGFVPYVSLYDENGNKVGFLDIREVE